MCVCVYIIIYIYNIYVYYIYTPIAHCSDVLCIVLESIEVNTLCYLRMKNIVIT